MEKTRKSPGVKVKKKMTKEQMQLAIIKKKECDAKALAIVEQLLEPQVDPIWLIENLKNINRCHMEDVIEERAITKLCGYVLCQKPLTVVINQRYHISLKSKKVFDVTKRKNFCSSSCFGASNYLLEQMLTSPLWMRDKEEIPEFKIFSKTNITSNVSHGEEVDIALVERCPKDEEEDEKEKQSLSTKTALNINNKDTTDDTKMSKDSTKNSVLGNIEDFVLDTIKNISTENNNLQENSENVNNTEADKELKKEKVVEDSKLIKNAEDSINMNNELGVKITNVTSEIVENTNKILNHKPEEEIINKNAELTKIVECNKSKTDETDIIEQRVYFSEQFEKKSNDEPLNKQNINSSTTKTAEQLISSKNNESTLKIEKENNEKNSISHAEIEKEKLKQNELLDKEKDCKNEKLKKLKHSKKKKQIVNKVSTDVNLANRVEVSFQEWVTEETVHFLFGDDSVKQKAIEKIEQQNRYSILCEKLNRLQFEDEQEDVKVLEKPVLKPAPHFAVLKEEGEKLDLKVRAFYQGKTAIEEPVTSVTSEETTSGSETFLPLTETHAPQTLRRKIFLERLDQVLPDLLRTLAGNKEVYTKVCVNYTSVRCTAVKALVHTFSLSAKNIIFKTAEWTLVGLVIIKMLSLLDPWLADLLLTKQASMYISMILTSYKLDPHYLNLLVASFNPNMNLR